MSELPDPNPDEDGEIPLYIRRSDGRRRAYALPENIVTTLPTECEHFEVTGDKVTSDMEVFKQGYDGGWGEVMGSSSSNQYFRLQSSERQISEYSNSSDSTYMARYKKKPATAEDALAKLGHDEEARKAILDSLRDSGCEVKQTGQTGAGVGRGDSCHDV